MKTGYYCLEKYNCLLNRTNTKVESSLFLTSNTQSDLIKTDLRAIMLLNARWQYYAILGNRRSDEHSEAKQKFVQPQMMTTNIKVSSYLSIFIKVVFSGFVSLSFIHSLFLFVSINSKCFVNIIHLKNGE